MTEAPPKKGVACSLCGRAIEVCACCDEPDCPPPLCDACLREVMGKAMRRVYLHGGASFAFDVDDRPLSA